MPSLQTVQLTTDDLGTPLAEATFVIVDLETTGGSPREGGITEIGAVKVRGGTVIGELATLVNPGQPIPPFIAALTGITDPMVAVAPTIAPVLASFLEFLADATLVAHNAPYDVGFLKGACSRADLTWPATRVLDTARIARTALLRDEVPNCRLETLARHFGTAVQPTHRALDDARATVEVFHALLERLGALGVHSVEELQTFTSRVNPVQRAKRTLADGLPHAPGVYVFKDPQGHPLYIGTSSNIARRVRTYFTASETRQRMTEMVRIAETVEAITCVTRLEAQVREIRLIAKEQPRYNRRGRRPGSQTWIRVDTTGGVALRLVQHISSSDDGVHHLGPWSSKSAAEPTRRALDWVLRQ
ncbi:MAG: DEDD exonuclease domain-containing protein, partial [Actinomycetales bacterium]